MSYNEKLSLIISSIAIIVSIASPFITYYLLDPQVQAFRNRGILKATEMTFVFPTKIIPISSPDSKATIPITISNTAWGMEIENVGNLPAKDVLIVFRYYPLPEDSRSETEYLSSGRPIDPKVKFDPPMPADVTPKGENELEISLKRSIAPGDSVKLQTPYGPDVVWVSNEFNETSTFHTYIFPDHLQRLRRAGKLPDELTAPQIDPVR